MHESVRSRSACGRLLGRDVDAAQRLGQRGQRLHRAARTTTRVAGGHAALDAAGAVGLAEEALLLGPEDLVVGLRADAPGEVEAVADPHALHRLDRHDRPGQPAVEALLPGDVRADARHEAEGAHLEDAAERLVRLPRACRSRRPSPRSRRRRGSARATRPRPRSPPAARSSRSGAATAPMRVTCEKTLTPSARRKRLGERAGGHARRGLARRGALEHVAHVGVAVLQHAGQVGVARARQVDLVDLGVDRPRVHPLLPVAVVAVVDPQRHRAAERAAVADPGDHVGAVLLDLHAPAAAVAELAPREVAVDVLRGQLEPGRAAPRRSP